MTELQTNILDILSDKPILWRQLINKMAAMYDIKCNSSFKRDIGKALLDLEARGLVDSTAEGVVAIDKVKRSSYNNGYHNMTGRKKG